VTEYEMQLVAWLAAVCVC